MRGLLGQFGSVCGVKEEVYARARYCGMLRRVGGTWASVMSWAGTDWSDIALSVYSAQIGFGVRASVIAPMIFDQKNLEDPYRCIRLAFLVHLIALALDATFPDMIARKC